ncbi:MAG: adenylate kinase [Deltaproteobacteria bacterium]|jgi:adenylate kinase|nr:adenylate kinase [Deltaproteobacteria bacterium]
MYQLIFLGAPGAGKGKQAEIFAQNNKLANISTGVMLRNEIASGSALGLELKPIIETGALVSDELVISLIEHRLTQIDCQKGYIFDGFPRTIQQAEELEKFFIKQKIKLPLVVMFDISDENLLARLENRRNSDEHRADDAVEVQKNRLQIYREQTVPLIDYYKQKGQLVRVDANADVEVVQQRLVDVLNVANNS